MSRDWTIYCEDCHCEMVMTDANWRIEDMKRMIAHGETIAKMYPLQDIIELKYIGGYGYDLPGFFRIHWSHKLTPIDEYGNTLLLYQAEILDTLAYRESVNRRKNGQVT